MQRISIKAVVPEPVEIVGAAEWQPRGSSGLAPLRLPAWAHPQLDPGLHLMQRMPSGARLRFRTDSRRVGLHFLATNTHAPGQERRAVPLSLETAAGLKHARSTAGNAITIDLRRGRPQMKRGEADDVVFECEGPAGVCDLWLPHNAMIEVRELLLDDGATLTAAPSSQRPRWFHYGSSISHCMEATHPAEVWPAVAARAAGLELRSFGFGGQCHLDQCVARTIRDAGPDLLSIKVGINVVNMDSMRERVFSSALHGFLDTIRERLPELPIALISPIYCGPAEDTPGPTLMHPTDGLYTVSGHDELRWGCMSLSRVRTLIEHVVGVRVEHGDGRLRYFDGRTLFGVEDEHDLPDKLHPNAAGYIRIGKRFAEHVAPWLLDH